MSNSYVTILDKLSKAVETNAKYKVEDALNKNLLAEDARKYDGELLNLLQKDASLKSHFFTETDGGLIFKKDIFLQFISNKEFLPDSYTRYANKIGLGSDDGSLLSGSKDVVLNWPYKDAILEGGQDKEDQKRSEVFFNEVLAPDQITRLLDNKVFTNWKRYDKDGEHELDELKDDDNLIIKGNNLVVLHSLKKRYAGKVKLIYIDPPYNTGGDSFGYNDKFNHATWMTFMKNRLEQARKLLSDDGQIFIHIDHTEQAYLKVLCDEVFGRRNFVQIVSVKTSTPSGVKVVNPGPVNVTEFVLNYSKNKPQVKFKHVYRKDNGYQKDYSNFITNRDAKPSDWIIEKVQDRALSELGYESKKDLEDKVGKNAAKHIIETACVDFCVKNADNVFATFGANKPSRSLQSHIDTSKQKRGEIIEVKRDDKSNYYILNGRLLAFYKNKLKTIDNDIYPAQIVSDFWDDMSWDSVSLEGGVKLSNGKKPERFIKRIIELGSEPGDIILDYHLGSGTTAAVAHKMGRQYIGVEQLYYGDNDPTVRLKNVIDGDQTGVSKSVDWQGGGSFVYANIMNNANTFRERVEKAKDDKVYLALLEEATSSSFLSYRVDPTKLNETEFRKLSSADKRRLLLEIIDNNTLYVNYEDINDPSFKVSDSDKKFNEELYK